MFEKHGGNHAIAVDDGKEKSFSLEKNVSTGKKDRKGGEKAKASESLGGDKPSSRNVFK